MVVFSGFRTAIRTLSSIPLPGSESPRLSDSLVWFPWVGCLLGGILWMAGSAFSAFAVSPWPQGNATLLVILSVFLTRGLHLDGLADCADGFGAGGDRHRMLRIMKDSHVGAFGAIALILILVAKWAALARLAELRNLQWVVPAFVVSRAVMVELAVRLPYAREEDGTGAPFIRDGRRRQAWCAWLSAILLSAVTLGRIGPGVAVLGWGLAHVLARWWQRRLGGVTGDLLGASAEITETTLLVGSAALAPAWTVWLAS